MADINDFKVLKNKCIKMYDYFGIQSVLWRLRKVYYTSEFRFRGVFLYKM